MENKSNLIGKSNLDVWAIQKDPEHVLTALKLLEYQDDDIILFTNCITKFRIGDRRITTRQFDTVLTSPKNDIVIFLQRDGIAEPSDMARFLDKRNFSYQVVVGEYISDNYINDEEIPELWFAREEFVLKDALEESLSKGITSCMLYNKLDGELSVGYYKQDGNFIEIEGRFLQGIVETEDKMILMINHKEERNLDFNDVARIVKECNLDCDVITEGMPKIFLKSKKIK